MACLLNVVGKALAISIRIGGIRRRMIRNMYASGQCKSRLHYSVVSNRSPCIICYTLTDDIA